jgi:anthranilate/para-aminobenzoate synthase component I
MRYEVSPANGFIKMMNSLNQLFLNNGQGHQRAATSDEVETALFKLESNPGIYFGVDAGIEGMHPLQATLVAQASLQFDVYEDGIELQALSKLGHQLLHSAEVTNWIAASARGSARSVQDSLQQFLALFEPSENLLLSGAFQFDAHKLHNVKTKKENENPNPLGVLFFAEKIYRRQGPVQSAWELIDLSGDEASKPAKPTKPAPQSNPIASPQDDMPPGGYAQMVLRAIDNLKSTDLVSLTLSQAYRKQVSMLPTTAFNNLRQANPAPA